MLVHVVKNNEETNEIEKFTMNTTHEGFMLYLENIVDIVKSDGFIKNFSMEPYKEDEFYVFITEK